ncbi:MAG: acetyltransferase [Tetragenococcus koreensis]|uniref:acetyltransferase n=1 Tax=Tetragenococcus halophilus TaxID=51669 RepID=UPI001F34142B|nr:acetyltransferase [Tetragenococcus halophilus]MCF1675853.1 acetyltransferase [Tetragenococcus halophilus]MDN6140677.1 acetyltransferase [Tetragenococcus koreensis]MDN6541915.1 acetyltransferase [Tetragenococcus koreensis]MDN6735833.1 acetyltransferase [Tetragenococcus koreensis]
MQIIIVGAGGFGKEVAFSIDRLQEYNVIGFVDDNYQNISERVYGKPVIGTLKLLQGYTKEINVVIAIADPISREVVYEKLKSNKFITFPNIIDSTAILGHNIQLGIGNILMANTTYTSDIEIGDFNMLNIASTVGHDSKVGSFNSIFPAVNVSGNVEIGNKNQFGVGTKVIQNLIIGDNNILGAGSVVIKNIHSCSKFVGVPSKEIESWDING